MGARDLRRREKIEEDTIKNEEQERGREEEGVMRRTMLPEEERMWNKKERNRVHISRWPGFK